MRHLHANPRGRFLLLTTAVILGLVACGGGAETDTGGGGDAAPAGDANNAPTELFATDLEQVCAGGTVASTPEYEGTKNQIHPLVAFEGDSGDYTEMSLDFPEGWVVMYPDYAKTELVACLERTSEKFVKTCKGYESDENPGETFSVDLYNADYDATLYATQSGDEVGTTTLKSKEEECPLLAFFDEGEQTQIDYALPDNLLREFVQKYVAP